MERRTVDGVDKQRDAQRARSRASGAENNPINTTGDPAAAAGGHVGGRAKLWCGERAASGRVASSRPCHVVQRAISTAMFMGDPPKTFGIGFGLWTGRYKLLDTPPGHQSSITPPPPPARTARPASLSVARTRSTPPPPVRRSLPAQGWSQIASSWQPRAGRTHAQSP